MKRSPVHTSVFTISAILALALFGDSLLYSALPLYAESLGIPVFMVGVLLSINRWVRLISNPLAARMLQRYSLPVLIFIACLATVTSTMIYAFPLGVIWFVVARVIWGISFSHFRLGGYMIILQTSRHVLGLAMGTMQSISRLGSAFTVIAGGVLIDVLGYQQGMVLLAILSGLAIPLVFVLQRQLTTVADNSDEGVPEDGEKELTGDLTLPAQYSNAVGLVTHIIANGLVVSSLSIVLRDRIGLSADVMGITLGITTISGLVFSIHWLSALIVSSYAGSLCDRYGRRLPFLIASSLQIVCLAILAFASSALPTVLFASLFFVLTNSQKVFVDAAVGDSAHGERRAFVESRYNSFEDLGAAIGPLIGYGVGALLGFPVVYALGSLLLLVTLTPILPWSVRLIRHGHERRKGSML